MRKIWLFSLSSFFLASLAFAEKLKHKEIFYDVYG
jgi:hypothetical protein